ncbi:MAG: hypothetical protein ACPHCN_08430 [Mycobacterium sp.]
MKHERNMTDAERIAHRLNPATGGSRTYWRDAYVQDVQTLQAQLDAQMRPVPAKKKAKKAPAKKAAAK